MAGYTNPPNRRRLSLLAGLLALAGPAHAESELLGLAGTSPGERAAIVAVCKMGRGAIESLCYANQLAMLARLGRKPDMSPASASQRAAIIAACSNKRNPGERFGCERAQLAAAGLPVRDEAGAGPLHIEFATSAPPTASQRLLTNEQPVSMPFFSLEKWRNERPAMPPARAGAAMRPSELYARVAPSVYIVLASDHAIELAERTAQAQGSAVAVTDRILLTNCHVVTGRPQISLAQQGQTGRATLVYADPGGDRCFLRSDTMPVHPIQGVRRFDDLAVGEPVFSLGAPVGLELSFGEGMVSGLREFEGVRVVQNSAPSWHGSSGGGLFDARGNLVGITTAASSTVPNLNFSIAAEDFWP